MQLIEKAHTLNGRQSDKYTQLKASMVYGLYEIDECLKLLTELIKVIKSNATYEWSKGKCLELLEKTQ